MPKVSLFNVAVNALTMQQTVDLIDEAIANGQQLVHNCINANKVVLMEKDKFLEKSLQEADVVSADGQAVVWASKLLGRPLPERVPGIDLFENLMQLSAQKGYKVFLLGAKEEIVSKVAAICNIEADKQVVTGFRNGYFKKSDEQQIINQINQSEAQLLFVAIPSPQKEIFINTYRHQMPEVKLLMGVGGSFDVVADKVKRAPRWMQKIGFEWLYRLIQEPKKLWKRYLIGNVNYILITLKAYFSKK